MAGNDRSGRFVRPKIAPTPRAARVEPPAWLGRLAKTEFRRMVKAHPDVIDGATKGCFCAMASAYAVMVETHKLVMADPSDYQALQRWQMAESVYLKWCALLLKRETKAAAGQADKPKKSELDEWRGSA